jgi:3-dehydroquinate synthase
VNELPTIVRLALGRASYDIEIGTGTLPRVGEFLAARRKATHAAIITDENVEQSHAARVASSLAGAGMAIDLFVVEPGESSKSVAVADRLWRKLLDVGADRKTIIVAVGGGVVGDLAGFVAATYARGLAYVQVPTTLLAQVDSAIGGKVGVNLPAAKNMVGAFWQPLGVAVDTQTLDTLPEREYRAGLAEVVKYGVILDAVFFDWLEHHVDDIRRREPSALRHAIARSCRLKADVVERDEREETGLRAVLNYGHTFAHAFETLTGYKTLLHGEAVSMGMICASRLAERLGCIDGNTTRRQRDLLDKLGLPVEPPRLDPEAVLETMSRDKKVEHGRLRFVLPTRLGHVELIGDVGPEHVRQILATAR